MYKSTDQFEIRDLFSINIIYRNSNFSLTNIGLYLLISLIIIIIL